MVLAGAQSLHVRKHDDLQAAVLGPLQCGRSQRLDGDDYPKGARAFVEDLVDFEVVLHQHHDHIRLRDDERAGVDSEGVVEGHNDQRVAVGSLLQEDPFRSILRIDSDERARLQAQSDQSRAKVLRPQQRLVVVHPLIGGVGGLPPAQTMAVIGADDPLPEGLV